MRRRERMERGAIRLGFLDVLTAAIMLGILAFTAYRQFPAYQRPTAQKTENVARTDSGRA